MKAAVAGAVEIDFGSAGMGAILEPAFDAAGMIPHTLAFIAGNDTTLTASLVRLHGETLDLDTPILLATGAAVFSGDVIRFDATSTDEYCDRHLVSTAWISRLPMVRLRTLYRGIRRQNQTLCRLSMD